MVVGDHDPAVARRVGALVAIDAHAEPAIDADRRGVDITGEIEAIRINQLRRVIQLAADADGQWGDKNVPIVSQELL